MTQPVSYQNARGETIMPLKMFSRTNAEKVHQHVSRTPYPKHNKSVKKQSQR